MTNKQYISADQLLEDSFKLGTAILTSGFRPNFIVGIWRGGTPVGIAVQELLDYFGVRTDHIAIRTSSYQGMNQRGDEVRVHGLSYLIKNINAEDALLIVDDVYDTGLSVQSVIHELHRKCRKNIPDDIRVATAYFKPTNNKTDIVPDYYVHETANWLVFPHELDGLTPDEIIAHKPALRKYMQDLEAHKQRAG
ncbi:MAG: phosphoribosyltransferase [Gammaproteobacteria bacterium]